MIASPQKSANAVRGTRPWYMGPLDEQLIRAESAPPDIREAVLSFVRDGYAVVRNSVPDNRCEEAIAGFRRLVRNNPSQFNGLHDENGLYHRIVNVHLAADAVLQAFLSNTALRVVSFLFGVKP